MLFFLKNKLFIILCWIFLGLAASDIEIDLPRPLKSFVFVVDVTMSMNVEDKNIGTESVSRLEFTKKTLSDAIPGLTCGTYVGLGVFAGYQTTILYDPIEVCEHFSDILKSIENLNTGIIWAGDSEVSKGLFNALNLVGNIQRKSHVVFFTDGHEAPPISAKYRPRFDKKNGVEPGIIIGVGGDNLVGIPRISRSGERFGMWGEDDVFQLDQFSLGRKGSDSTETLVDEPGFEIDPLLLENLQATPGKEHMSSLRGKYLKLLADEHGLHYEKLDSTELLLRSLDGYRFASWRKFETNVSIFFALCAMFCLLMVFVKSFRKKV